MNKNQIIIAAVLIAVVGGVFLYTNNSAPVAENNNAVQSGNLESPKEQALNQDEAGAGEQTESKNYIEYSEANFAQAVEGNSKPVLFFAALSWCPTCQAADRDFKQNLTQIPEDVTVLIVDYDNSQELKKKYAITMQDTFVQVDPEGNEIAKWNSGGEGIKSLLANVK